MRRLICNEFLSLNAFGFVFYDLLRLQRFVLVLVFLAFDFLAFVFLAFDLVFLAFDLVLLAFDLAPPLGLESNILVIATDLSIPEVQTKWSNESSNTCSNPTNTLKYGFGFCTLPTSFMNCVPAYGFAVIT